MNNSEFLEVIKKSFITCLMTHERSTAKLKVLHGAIARDIYNRLNTIKNIYDIISKGFNTGKEYKIQGRYIDKNVDITVIDNGIQKAIAGIAVKFVMSNYSQNSNNYFENMLGETANIRSMNIPYFNIFIIPEILPYYKRNGEIKKEKILQNIISKNI